MIKLLKNLHKKELLLIAVSVGLIVAVVWLDLKMPSYMSEITTLLKTDGSISDILKQGLYMLLCTLSSVLLTVVINFIVAKVATAFSARLRKNVFNKVQEFSTSEIKKFSTASLITRSTNDVTQIQSFLGMALNVVFKAPILAVWAIVTILGKSWQWSLATGVAVAALLIFVTILILFVFPKFSRMQKLTDNLNKVTRENLVGVRVVRAFNAEDFEKAKFENVNEDLTKTNRFASRMLELISPFMSIMMSTLTLAIYWIGAILIQNAAEAAKLSLFSDMIVFSSYAMQVISAFIMLIIIFINFPRATVSAKRINEVLNTKLNIVDGEGKDIQTGITGEVEFKNVSFKYPDADEYVIKDISFKATKGQTVAFIGSTGSGKSTLINLVPRLYDATEGDVLVDGVNVLDYKLSELNNKIGYISQKAHMFRGSIKSNVRYGDCKKEITDENILTAIEIAQAKDLVASKENGIDSEVSQGGTNLSGGQKQRISIARAIAKRPEILIFDDSFSALDYTTDKKVRQALKRKTKEITNLIVAQRIGTIKDADQIIVLDKGRMVGIGTHDYLMKKCAVYKEIALSQLSKEELIGG